VRLALLVAALVSGRAECAVVRGTVVENQTGKPLARAVVVIQPIAGTPGESRSVRTTQFGGFEFASLPAGYYVLQASRRGFMSMEHGQKRWNSAGYPLAVEESAAQFVSLRLPRFSAVTGTLVDENDVGLPNHDVAAFRTGSPPELMSQATTDDRGVYRLYGLTPGTYVVRTAGKQYEEGAYGPTYSRETDRMEQARTVELFPEQQAAGVDVRPLPGRLYTLSVGVSAPPLPDGSEITLTLASILGRKVVKGTTGFAFRDLAPGDYDASVEITGERPMGASQRVVVRGNTSVTLYLPQNGCSIWVTGGPEQDGELQARRRDLAGAGTANPVPLARGRASLLGGRWEVMMTPPSGYYVSGLTGLPGVRADGWVECRSPGSVRFQLAGGPGAVRGVVKSSGDPVIGAPVYLEGWDAAAKKRIADLRTTRTDLRGQYAFTGLAPGDYRILSTFEYAAPDAEAMAAADSAGIALQAHSEATRDLELYVIR
jgi:hypothetical protein